MTAHYIAQIVQCEFDKVDLDEMSSGFDNIVKYQYGRVSDDWVNRRIESKQYYRWLRACSLLETYLRLNYTTFVETELVYYWAKDICNRRNNDLNNYRMNGNPFNACPKFEDWLNKKR
jgi:hypothetical protein